MIEIKDLKIHKDVVIEHLKSVSNMINNIIKEAEKISKQKYSDFCKEHSDVLNLLNKHKKSDESFYECLERILKSKLK